MAKKTVVDKNVQEIRKLLKEDRIVIGTDIGLKNLKLGKVEKIFLASNYDNKEIKDLAKISKVDVVVVKQANDDLGTLCRKPFAISMLSVISKKLRLLLMQIL